jgi:hypothetical protein
MSRLIRQSTDRRTAVPFRAAIAAGAIVGLGVAIVGCQSSESEDWAQTAPLITPVERPTADDGRDDLYLGAWAEMTASRTDEPRASAGDADAIQFAN